MSTSENSAGCRRYMGLFCDEASADVHFLVGTAEKQTIPAHKQILTNANEVFGKMLSKEFEVEGPIEVPDIEPPTFLNLLRYFYGDDLELTVKNVHEVFYEAEKYMAQSVKNICEKFLLRKVTSANVFGLLSGVDSVASSNFLFQCMKKIAPRAETALKSEDFLKISLRTLRELLSQDHLACSEIYLFKRVVEWANANCDRQNLHCTPENQRSVLGDALDLVRFPLMTQEDFIENVPEKELLDGSAVIKLLVWFSAPSKHAIDYSTVSREIFDETEHCVPIHLWNEKCAFRCDKPILLLGVYSFISKGTSSISLSDCHGTTLSSKTSDEPGLYLDKKNLFDSPQKITKANWYTLKVTGTVVLNFCTETQLKRLKRSQAGVTFTFKENKGDGFINLLFRVLK